MEELLEMLFGILFHPIAIAFVLGGIVAVSFVVGTAYYYNRRGRGG